MLTPVINDRDMRVVTRIAEAVFLEYYATQWGKSTIHKILKQKYSSEALTEQIKSQTTHFLLIAPYLDAVGYVASTLTATELTITQFYISWHYRHKGYGDSALKEMEILARGIHKETLAVQVDAIDVEAIAFFEKRGFIRGESLEQEILPQVTLTKVTLTKRIMPQ